MNLSVVGTYMPLPKKLQDKKAIINLQNKRGTECLKCMVNPSGIVPYTKGKKSMQNDQLSHIRWDQLFRNCFSNPFERPWQAWSAKLKHCAQCFWLERKSDCVQNESKTERSSSDKLNDDHIWRYLALFLHEKRFELCFERLVVRPNEAYRKKTPLPSCGGCQASQQKEYCKSKMRPAQV